MSKKDDKFGTFEGVFTPSILTILGVIMYLRLPWVIGHSGLYMGLGVIAVAHVISITTGLSISSIATDKRVGAGGPYYIVSRSLGLPIGGTLGLALFVGLSFSISLYIIGFCESFLPVIGVGEPPAPDATAAAKALWNNQIRIAGTITIIALTILTFISTSLAIKSQFYILAAIGLSLVAIFLGGGGETTGIHTTPQNSVGVAAVFGIFFPAVTGFTAGVNMSGDLRDPKKAIPAGTMAAIGTGLVVYVALAVFLAARVPLDALLNDGAVLTKIAYFPGPSWAGSALVTLGICSATLSSALGSILGAPRILQALSVDRITPKWFGIGTGKTNEPRNALLVAFLIGEVGILIAELNSIAKVVSVVFLATYGLLNISSAIESWASPDFRPSFRIPRFVSVIGALTCALVMIQLEPVAMAGATVLLGALFLFLQRRQLTLDSGDTWEGIWSSIVRAGLHRLSHSQQTQRRNWRPIMLSFSASHSTARQPMLDLSRALISGNGMLTDFELVPNKREFQASPPMFDNDPVGVFRRRLVAEDPYATIVDACKFHGFSGLDPNTVLLDWDTNRKDTPRFIEMLRRLSELDVNQLFMHWSPEREFGEHKTIDIWWRPTRGNVALSLSMMRFITRVEPWQRAKVRFLLISEHAALSDDLLTTMRGLLADARLDARVKLVADPAHTQTIAQLVRAESSDADLVVLGMPSDLNRIDDALVGEVDELLKSMGTVLLVRGNSMFREVLPVTAKPLAAEALERAQKSATRLLPLQLPDDPALEAGASAFTDRAMQLSEQLYTHALAPVVARHEGLIDEFTEIIERQFDVLARGVDQAARKRKSGGKAQGGFLFRARKLLESFQEETLPTQTRTLKSRLADFAGQMQHLPGDIPRTIRVVGRSSAFAPVEGDDKRLRRFKWRRRVRARLRRSPPTYAVPAQALARHYALGPIAEAAETAVVETERGTHRLAVALGKLLGATAEELNRISRKIERGDITQDEIAKRKDDVLRELHEASGSAAALTERVGTELAQTIHGHCQAFANDFSRIDAVYLPRRERRVARGGPERLASLEGLPEAWLGNQTLLLNRAQLGLQLAAFQTRFAAMAARAKKDLVEGVRNSALGDAEGLLERLRTFVTDIEAGAAPKASFDKDIRPSFDGQPTLDVVLKEIDVCVEELPESIATTTDDAIASLESQVSTEIDEVTLSVRPLVKFLIESEFLDALRREIGSVPQLEERLAGVAQDVCRLLNFALGDLEVMGGWSNEAFRKQIASVAKDGANRLERELEALQTLRDELGPRIDALRDTLRDDTDPYGLTSRSDSINLYMRSSREGKKAVSKVWQLFLRIGGRLRVTMVALLYRRSTGILLARRLQRHRERGGLDHVVATCQAMTPRASVLQALPFYYRQLFSGQATISDTFWVGRQHELELLRAAIRRQERGAGGLIFVVGETGSGKTALCHHARSKFLPRRQFYRVTPPQGGSIDPAAFTKALQNELNRGGPIGEMIAGLPKGAVLLFDDLEMWWERSPDGMAILHMLERLVEAHGEHVVIMANLNVHAWRVIAKLSRLPEHALAVIECDALPAEELKSIISVRHGSTGLTFTLDKTDQDELAPWREARLFTRYFDISHGLVAPALRSWLTHIDKIEGENLQMRWPKAVRGDVLAGLRIELMALLLQLIVHKQVNLERLQRITRLSAKTLSSDIDTLVRLGLVRRNPSDSLHVDRYVAHLVADQMRNRGLLA